MTGAGARKPYMITLTNCPFKPHDLDLFLLKLVLSCVRRFRFGI